MRGPLYLQICNDLRRRIEKGAFPYGSRLPSERELAQQYQVDRKTLRRAVDMLEEEGILQCIRGKGIYISRQLAYQIDLLDDLEQMMKRSGMTLSTRVLLTETRRAGRKYAQLLGIGPDDLIFRLLRLRTGDGEVMALQDTYVVYDLIPGLETLDFQMYSLYHIMSRNGIEVRRIQENFIFLELSNPEADILQMQEGATGFVTEDKTIDQYGRTVEYTKSIINSEKLSIDMSYVIENV